MENKQNNMLLNTAKGLVMNCECNILIIKVLDEWKFYLAPVVRLKTRECRYNEAQDAQDVTGILDNLGHNFPNGMTSQRLLEVTQSIHKENFKFGTDDYIWLTKVDLNR